MLIPYEQYFPEIHSAAWIAEQSLCLGRVFLGEHSSIWYNCVARADINFIKIGSHSNIQDGTILHVGDEFPVQIGDYVTVGHGARLHGCTIEDRVLIGIGAIILNGAVVGSDSVIGAGCLVPEGQKLEGRKLYLGVPAKPVRALTPEEIEKNVYWAEKYVKVARKYKEEVGSEKSGGMI